MYEVCPVLWITLQAKTRIALTEAATEAIEQVRSKEKQEKSGKKIQQGRESIITSTFFQYLLCSFGVCEDLQK